MSLNLAAFTPPGSLHPPYLSVNLLDDNTVEVTVRSESVPSKFSRNMSVVGEVGRIVIPFSEFVEVLRQLSIGLGRAGI